MIVFCFIIILFFVFFFKQKTAYEMRISDWSSDVCSSDLRVLATAVIALRLFENPVVLGARGRAAFDTGHAWRSLLQAIGRPEAHMGCVRIAEDRKSVV